MFTIQNFTTKLIFDCSLVLCSLLSPIYHLLSQLDTPEYMLNFRILVDLQSVLSRDKNRKKPCMIDLNVDSFSCNFQIFAVYDFCLTCHMSFMNVKKSEKMKIR